MSSRTGVFSTLIATSRTSRFLLVNVDVICMRGAVSWTLDRDVYVCMHVMPRRVFY